MELGSLAATAWAVVTYCTTTLDEKSTSDAQEEAAKWNTASAVIAFTVSPLVRKIIGSCANSLEAVENRQQGVLTLEQAQEQIAILRQERDAALRNVSARTEERDTARTMISQMQVQVATSATDVRSLRFFNAIESNISQTSSSNVRSIHIHV